ncbi:MAG TPA: NlpC/P60 family protein [Pseudogracilibacillus sp.]|nr:NlpC/P60 family protein [Pseudogracilibacillus sp.]
MQVKNMHKVMKHSLAYSYVLAHPLAFYVDADRIIIAEDEVISYKEHGEIVSNIQHKLQKTGHYEDKIDGVYGLLTEHAVKGFQSSNNLEVTGAVDYETMQRLIQEEKRIQFAQIAHIIDEISFSEQSDKVKQVQEILFYYGYYDGTIDGIYGPLTENAISKLYSDNILQNSSEELSESTTTSVQEIEEETNETTDVVHVTADSTSQSVIHTATSLIGTPYSWGGTSPNGFDCSGFIQFVYDQHDITIPRTVNEIWNFATEVGEPSIGDLVFFETYQAGPSHLGLYIGNNEFIHAGSSNGVQTSHLNESYWQSRYLGAKRIK